MLLRSPRSHFIASVGVLRQGQREVAYIENVSKGGLKLKGLKAVVAGEILQVHARGAVFDCQVRWINGPSCGVRFMKENALGEVNRFLNRVQHMKQGRSMSAPEFREIGHRHTGHRPP